MANQKTIKILDYIIFSFIIIFLASLTNSIFVNQLGYYGALIFLLIKYFISKENPFEKTGLEIPILLFIAAEIFSTIFSLNQPQAFQNLLKRVLLLPIIYVIASGTVDIKKGKLFFKTYIGFALISCLIYLYMSYDYWLFNKFALTESGPSVFNYPITAGELISFTIIFLFSFIINEKGSLKYKLFNSAAFIVAVLALISTYKRTGWIGTAAGILAVLIMKKQWKIIGAGASAVILLFIFEKNISYFSVYDTSGGNIEKVSENNTEGRAFDVTAEDYVFISDFENGVLIFNNGEFVNKIEIPGAVNKFEIWKNNFYIAALADSRFLLYNNKSGYEFEFVNEFISPGFVQSFEIKNDLLYVNDLDSGLTIFRNPELLTDTLRFPLINRNNIVRVESTKLFCYSKLNGIKIHKLENFLPARELFSHKPIEGASLVDFVNGKIFISDKSGSGFYNYSEMSLSKNENEELPSNIYLIQQNENKLFFSGLDKKLYAAEIDSAEIVKIISSTSVDELITSIDGCNNKIYTTTVREARLKSIFDPNKVSNFVRLALWRAGILIFKDHPVFGVGDIDLAFLYKEYKRYYDKEIQGHLHNNYIHLLAILGAFGFFAAMYLLLKIFFMNIKIYNSLQAVPFISSVALGSMGAFVSFLVAGLTEWNFGDHEIITMVWFTVGLNIAFYKLSEKKHKD
ncbi:MAG: O-antigen ligase family protein [Melioribacteraceae bacterium]|nr:MAG: O-antigen ligase family protein [Melioribacteraceae bacterium]